MKFKLKTANDYELLEAVSSLQKCIRRGLEEEAMFWAAEIETKFADYLWVRLTVIVNEDIGLAEPAAIQLIEALRQQYQFLRKNSKSPSERLPLANAIIAMCRAKKTRLADDFQTVVSRRRDFKGWRLEIPDFALDKHTRRGKQLGRGVDHWREEGCKLSNEIEGMNPYEKEATELRERYARVKKNDKQKKLTGLWTMIYL